MYCACFKVIVHINNFVIMSHKLVYYRNIKITLNVTHQQGFYLSKKFRNMLAAKKICLIQRGIHFDNHKSILTENGGNDFW